MNDDARMVSIFRSYVEDWLPTKLFSEGGEDVKMKVLTNVDISCHLSFILLVMSGMKSGGERWRFGMDDICNTSID